MYGKEHMHTMVKAPALKKKTKNMLMEMHGKVPCMLTLFVLMLITTVGWNFYINKWSNLKNVNVNVFVRS